MNQTMRQASQLFTKRANHHVRKLATHGVTNQPTAMRGYNAFLGDVALHEAVQLHGGEWGVEQLSQLGAQVGSSEWQERSRNANASPPNLATHDRFGNRIDCADFHPAYHDLMRLGLEAGAASWAWQPEHRGKAGAHVIRGSFLYLMYQLNPGVCCPITMSFAALPALRGQGQQAAAAASGQGDLIDALRRKLEIPAYCGKDAPLPGKAAATMGMSMTEKQGGSDVRSNTTTATPVSSSSGADGRGEFVLDGHKWFTSAPMSDAFLTLAQVEGAGLSCVHAWPPLSR